MHDNNTEVTPWYLPENTGFGSVPGSVNNKRVKGSSGFTLPQLGIACAVLAVAIAAKAL